MAFGLFGGYEHGIEIILLPISFKGALTQTRRASNQQFGISRSSSIQHRGTETQRVRRCFKKKVKMQCLLGSHIFKIVLQTSTFCAFVLNKNLNVISQNIGLNPCLPLCVSALKRPPKNLWVIG